MELAMDHHQSSCLTLLRISVLVMKFIILDSLMPNIWIHMEFSNVKYSCPQLLKLKEKHYLSL